MSERERDPICRVALLVPHPTRTAVLVATERDEPAGSPACARLPTLQLPTLELPGEEPLLSDIVALVDVMDGDTTPVLRQVVTASGDDQDAEPGEPSHAAAASELLVEFEAGTSGRPPGWTWQAIDAETIGRLEPATSRAAVAAWARERDEGWSPARPAWSLPGWFARASAWVLEQMEADGGPATGPVRQHQLWGVSAVLRVPGPRGDAYFKCSLEIFRHEAVTTRALAEHTPDLMPHVIAVEPVQGWMLMRDLGALELGEQDEETWDRGVVAHARIQQHWLGRTDELVGLGLPVRSLTDLAAQVEEMGADAELLGRMPPGLREAWSASAPALVRSCERLDRLVPGPTLVHGDFHPWNVVSGSDATRVFDWSDAAVSHPFVDLATYIFRTRNLDRRRHLVDACIDAWSDVAEEEQLREAARLGLVVGALYQAQTYRALLPTLMGEGVYDGMADGDVQWLDRSLRRHELGLTSPS